MVDPEKVVSYIPVDPEDEKRYVYVLGSKDIDRRQIWFKIGSVLMEDGTVRPLVADENFEAKLINPEEDIFVKWFTKDAIERIVRKTENETLRKGDEDDEEHNTKQALDKEHAN